MGLVQPPGGTAAASKPSCFREARIWLKNFRNDCQQFGARSALTLSWTTQERAPTVSRVSTAVSIKLQNPVVGAQKPLELSALDLLTADVNGWEITGKISYCRQSSPKKEESPCIRAKMEQQGYVEDDCSANAYVVPVLQMEKRTSTSTSANLPHNPTVWHMLPVPTLYF